MTQALLNNLTNQVNQFEKTVDFASKKSDTKMDFQNLFLQKSKQNNANKTLNNEEKNAALLKFKRALGWSYHDLYSSTALMRSLY